MVSVTMTTSIPRVSGALGRAAPSAGGPQTAKPFLAAGRLGRQAMSSELLLCWELYLCWVLLMVDVFKRSLS